MDSYKNKRVKRELECDISPIEDNERHLLYFDRKNYQSNEAYLCSFYGFYQENGRNLCPSLRNEKRVFREDLYFEDFLEAYCKLREVNNILYNTHNIDKYLKGTNEYVFKCKYKAIVCYISLSKIGNEYVCKMQIYKDEENMKKTMKRKRRHNL